MKNFSDIWLLEYQKIAGLGAAQEFKLRMLANKHGLKFTDNKSGKETLAASAFSASDTESAVFVHFDSRVTPEEKSFLTTTRQMRNKLLHCDFGEFVSRLEKLMENQLPKSTVRKIAIPEDGQGIIEALTAAQANFSSLPTVDDSKDTDIFGRFLSCANRGALREAEKTYHRSIAILDRLLEES
jgi:hypothetical protein